MKIDPNWTPPVPHPVSALGAICNLQHTLDVFGEEASDEEFVVIATSNIYDDGVRTGLTWGDLRHLARYLRTGQ